MPSTPFALPGFSVLSVSGADARSFLHGQLTVDVEALTPGFARLAGYCSPKGRLLANFLIVARADEFLLVVPSALAAALAKRLSLFILRAKVKLAAVPERLVVAGERDPGGPGLLPGTGPLVASDDGSTVSVSWPGPVARRLVLGPAAPASAEEAHTWAALDVRAGLPWILPETQDRFVPQMVNLEALGGVDFKKGCYPGQEVVARSQYLGRVKRRAVVMAVPDPLDLEPGAELTESGAAEPGAEVVNVVATEAGTVLLVATARVFENGASVRFAGPTPFTARVEPLPYALPEQDLFVRPKL